MRGVHVDNAKDYQTIGQYGVAVFMEVDLNHVFLPPSAQAISALPIPIHRQPLLPVGYSGGTTHISFSTHQLWRMRFAFRVSRTGICLPSQSVQA